MQHPQTPGGTQTKVFINYRREDTQSDAGRLEGDLKKHFPGRVFRDIHGIEAGRDFEEAIKDELNKCSAVLVLIGRRWLTATGRDGGRRLDDPHDYVVAEIAEVLRRSDARVIPVLLHGAEMPQADQLPDSLKSLVKRNALRLTDDYWNEGVDKLVKELEKVCGPSGMPETAARGVPAKTAAAGAGRMKLAGAAGVCGLAVVLALILLGWWLTSSSSEDDAAAVGKSQAAAVGSANANASPTAAAASLERRAVVQLAQKEAEFFFPFDTTGDEWTWWRKTTPAGEEEYSWGIFVPGDYMITVSLKKDGNHTQQTGDFRSLLYYTDEEVESREPDKEEYAPVNKEESPWEIERDAEPGGLRLTVKGEGVSRIFAKQPKEVTFLELTPEIRAKSETGRELGIPVVYK